MKYILHMIAYILVMLLGDIACILFIYLIVLFLFECIYIDSTDKRDFYERNW